MKSILKDVIFRLNRNQNKSLKKQHGFYRREADNKNSSLLNINEIRREKKKFQKSPINFEYFVVIS